MRLAWFTPLQVEESANFDAQPKHGPGVDPRFDIIKDDVFTLYSCHTNFAINEEFAIHVSLIPGVEILKPVTKYRCVIGFANGFNPTTVIASIKKKCLDEPNSLIGFDKLKGLEEPFKSKADNLDLSSVPYKLAYIFPNGKAEYYSTANADGVFINKCHTFSVLRKNYGGRLIVMVGGHCKDSKTEETDVYSFL